VEASRTLHTWFFGQVELWQFVPYTSMQAEAPSLNWMHSWPAGQPRASHEGRQSGWGTTSAQKKPSGQVFATSFWQGRPHQP
jgi:hypothetical protein